MRTQQLILAKISVLSAIIISFATPAHAQDVDYFTLSADELMRAEVISASRKPEKISETPAAIFVITQEDIRRAGVTTIPDALRMAPGVEVAQPDSNSWSVSIRGFSSGLLSSKILVMIDGRSVYNPLFAGTYWELQDYVLDDIERIEVIRGPGGALWGANAVNGVINIITKKARDTQGELANALYGREERGTVSVRHGGTFGFDNHYRVYAKYTNHDSFHAPAGGDTPDDWWSERSGFRADWGERLTLQGDAYRTLTGQNNSTPAFPAPIIEEETMSSNGANLLGRWTEERNNGAKLTVQTYLDYTERNQILLHDQRGIFDWDAQYNFPPQGSHEVSSGLGYRLIHDDLGDTALVSFRPASRTDNLFTFFAQDKITLQPQKWYLTLGTKFEHNDYSGFEAQPNVRLQFHPDSTQMVWGAVSRAVRTPSRLEQDLTYTLGFFPGPTEVVLHGNPNLDSEELVAYEAGYRKQITPALSLDVAAFFNDYDKLGTFGFLPTSPGLFPVTTVNGMTGESYGTEIAASWAVTDDFKLSGSYSFIDLYAHVKNNGGFNLETAEDMTPHHQANIRASWNLSSNISLDTSLYYVDDIKQSNVEDYLRMDINLGWKINDNLRFNLTGQNLLDDAHREALSPGDVNAAEVQRSIFGKFTWRY